MGFKYLLLLQITLFCSQVLSSALPNSATRFKRGADTEAAVEGHDWGYTGHHGPETWCAKYAACCGLMQSPINIIGDNTTLVRFFPIILQNYDLYKTVIITNNGHTLAVTLKSNLLVPTISGGHLRGTYKFAAIHFHWGNSDDHGSEHLRDGEAFPLEAHFVHYNTKYADAAAAQTHSDGLAVLGVFYQLGSDNNSDIAPIVTQLRNVEYADQSVEVPHKITLRDLLPRDLSQFFRYNGSLTTPPCSEVVTWTVFDAVRIVSNAQLREFRGDLHSGHEGSTGVSSDDLIADNHRDVQDGHDRLVQHNVKRWDVHRNFAHDLRLHGKKARHHG